ncbi:EpsG family protein [Arthrobacter sp. VKM Ac-2550]|uniref:EpsG family protein n=1 Tax=Crystallibacter permensis TaxID=1938888 RepID=UPI0022260F29|nr:EpsG family protein [Arthrobacter sp. VKM Ac-2550]MCW2132874.1 EpsG family protein [Arthrobacter sp. VKM Ac-2550]
MLPYFAVTAATGFLSWLSEFIRNTPRSQTQRATERPGLRRVRVLRWTPIDFFIIAVMVTFSAVRYEVGTDYGMYARRFQELSTVDWSGQLAASPQEIGYTALSLFLRGFTDNPSIIFWVTSALTVIPVYAAIKKQSLNPTMSLLLYVLLAFFVAPFNIIRQGIAISLSFYASTFLDRNKTAFVIINAIAATFHTSAILVAVIQLLARNAKPTKKKALILGVVALVAAGGISQWSFLSTFLNSLNERYDTYLGAAAVGLGSYLVIVTRVALLAYAMRLGRSQHYQRYGMYVLIGIMFLIAGTQSEAVNRMELYFGIFLILLIPNQLAGRRDAGLHKVGLCIAGGIYLAMYLSNWGHLTPYQTYL